MSLTKFPPEELLTNLAGARLDLGGAGPKPLNPPGATDARPAPDFLNTEDGCGICDAPGTLFSTSPSV